MNLLMNRFKYHNCFLVSLLIQFSIDAVNGNQKLKKISLYFNLKNKINVISKEIEDLNSCRTLLHLINSNVISKEKITLNHEQTIMEEAKVNLRIYFLNEQRLKISSRFKALKGYLDI